MNKKTIKVYGTDSSGQQLVVSLIRKCLIQAGLDYNISKVTDINAFLDLKLESIPSIQLNDGKIYPLKEGNFFKQNLRKALSEIMSLDNFGNLKKFIVPIDFSESSINAFMYAHRLATKMEAVTEVLHIDTPNGNNLSKFNDFINQVDTDWNSDILKASLISKAYCQGPVKSTLINKINKTLPELIVIGNKFNSKHNQIDTNVNSILKTVNSNVLIVPSKAKYTQIKNIVYPYVDANKLENNLDFLVNIGQHFSSNITLANLNPSSDSSNSVKSNQLVNKYKGNNLITFSSAFDLKEKSNNRDIDIFAIDQNLSRNHNHLMKKFEEHSNFKSINKPVLSLR